MEGRKGWIKYVRNSWFRVEVDLFGHSIFILASWRRRCALRTVTLTRENAYARFRRRANDISCDKTGEVAVETTVTSDVVCTDVTRIWTGNLLLRQQLRVSALNAGGTKENEVFLWRKRRSALHKASSPLILLFYLKKTTETGHGVIYVYIRNKCTQIYPWKIFYPKNKSAEEDKLDLTEQKWTKIKFYDWTLTFLFQRYLAFFYPQ